MECLGRSLLIEVDHNIFGSARSCGFQFDNVVITHESLLYSLCSKNKNKGDEVLETLLIELWNQQYFVIPGKDNERKITFNFKTLRQNVPTARDSYCLEDVRLCLIQEFKDDHIINYIMVNNKNYNSCDVTSGSFLFLMTGMPSRHLFERTLHALLMILKGTTIYPGLRIAVESTPFCNLSFYNSLSQGIVCKTMGPSEEWFIIDAKLGLVQGAPVYIFTDGSKRAVIGLLAWQWIKLDEEFIGFSVVINIKHLLMSVLGTKAIDYIPFSGIQRSYIPSFSNDSPSTNIDQLSSAVVFVICQHKWGSGVVVDADAGLVLTCSHIVHHAQESVHVIFKGKKFHANVVFASPPPDPFDLALLSVGKIHGLRQLVLAEKSPIIGESVTTVGYALSTESSVITDGRPILSHGCVSKVSGMGGPLLTTCCTQSGVSGGAVMRFPDQLIGIVVSNIRVDRVGILPFFGIAVSVDDFRTPILQFLKTKDPTILQSLSVRKSDVKMKWLLQDSKL